MPSHDSSFSRQSRKEWSGRSGGAQFLISTSFSTTFVTSENAFVHMEMRVILHLNLCCNNAHVFEISVLAIFRSLVELGKWEAVGLEVKQVICCKLYLIGWCGQELAVGCFPTGHLRHNHKHDKNNPNRNRHKSHASIHVSPGNLICRNFSSARRSRRNAASDPPARTRN